MKNNSTNSKKSDITPRQTQILFGVAKGFTNREIGRTLDISTRTVEVHRFQLMKRLGANNVVQLLKCAVDKELITPTLGARKRKSLASVYKAG
ncbi:MAG: LuxR C-terminal-related transcriptional regulator [Alphaproteobacteria bacterium]